VVEGSAQEPVQRLALDDGEPEAAAAPVHHKGLTENPQATDGPMDQAAHMKCCKAPLVTAEPITLDPAIATADVSVVVNAAPRRPWASPPEILPLLPSAATEEGHDETGSPATASSEEHLYSPASRASTPDSFLSASSTTSISRLPAWARRHFSSKRMRKAQGAWRRRRQRGRRCGWR
jgi:hypothetical protein